VVHLGAEPVASSWPRSAPRWIVAEHAAPDADACAAGIVLGDVADILERASDAAPVHADHAWLASMRDAGARAAAAVAALAGPETEHAAVAAALAGAGDALVVIGNSLPVRLADHVPLPGPRRVICQRGASGIDGLIAGAAGAAATGEPVVLILGDVSLAHDAGSLALLRHARAPVTVVVIDNDGGRIFEALPVAGAVGAATLERLWLTPPRLDVVALARGFGLEAVTVRSPDALRAAVSARRTALLHVPVAPSSARAVTSSLREACTP
jgi:2-succinyl-5-enolpyruvyl-6-hydroxy-3-cyclohexene-1-carboxylate synthase